jgi:hypothetical protein
MTFAEGASGGAKRVPGGAAIAAAHRKDLIVTKLLDGPTAPRGRAFAPLPGRLILAPILHRDLVARIAVR